MSNNHYTFLLCMPVRLSEAEIVELGLLITESTKPFIDAILEARKNNVVNLKVVPNDKPRVNDD